MPRSQTALRRKPVRAAAAGAESLTEQAYRQIEEQIVTLRLKPGDVLSEQMLSATFGIGRTPVREALQRLAHEGLVIILPRKGILCPISIPGINCWCWKCAASLNGF